MDYDARNKIIYNTEVLKSNHFDLNDVHILVKGDITVIAGPTTQLVFKYWVAISKCIPKNDGTTTDDAEVLGLVMPVYNRIEYSSNYSETTGSL